MAAHVTFHTSKMASSLLSNVKRDAGLFLALLCIILMSNQCSAQLHDESFPAHPSDAENGRRLTREYRLKQGPVKGLILEPRDGRGLDGVEVFLGLPYASAPVGGFRFMPPGSATYWSSLRLATNFAPVCPQMLPDLKKEASISAGRYNYLKRLMPFLRNQSEDCLYLNVYVPYSDGYSPHKNTKRYPVMIFIHGESFEWNSGNPYDGTVLAAYGKIIVVTLNFRLGILGFMKPSISEHTIGNFGLLDQIAALQWVKDNIAVFHGDPNAVTLAGHGTGAACVNFLMVSPVANGLFHRAILMSGSALSDWSLTSNPIQFTIQAAQSLNCPLTADDLGECLRKKRLSEIMAVRVLAPEYMTSFGPIIDGSVIPNEPAQVMGVYKDLFSKYELLYGCSELESYHLLGAVALAHGMLESERDSLLRHYTQTRFEYRPDLALAATLKEYSTFEIELGRSAADTHRDSILDILSDARVVAPLVQTANFHSKANPKSFFYVFGHNSQSGEYAALGKSVHGEELAYMFGVPLGANKNHFREEYSPQEKLFSEVMMTFFTNFARTGNPNTPRKNAFFNLGPKDWDKYDIEWPHYNMQNQSFLHLGIPPYTGDHYRNRYMKYWNEELPHMLKNFTVTYDRPLLKTTKATPRPYRNYGAPPAWANPSIPKAPVYPDYRSSNPVDPDKYGRFNQYQRPPIQPKPTQEDPYNALKKMERPNRPMIPGLMDGPLKKWKVSGESHPVVVSTPDVQQPVEEPVVEKSNLTMNLAIAIGVLLLILNAIGLFIWYRKKSKFKARVREIKRNDGFVGGELPDQDVNLYEKAEKFDGQHPNKGCNLFSVFNTSSNKTDDVYEPVKNHAYDGTKTPKSDDSGGFGQRFKLRRHMSSSTLDAHTKVRDWIAHEIVQKCSPMFMRKNNEEIKQEAKGNGAVVHLLMHSEEDNPNVPKPNCKIGSLTGSLRATTDSTVSVGAKESKIRILNVKPTIPMYDKKSSKHGTNSAKSSKPSNKSISNKSAKSKHSQQKSGSDGSLTKRNKPQKVSVAIDATPGTRSSSVLMQEPIELSKSLDYCCYDDGIEQYHTPMRRSQTVEDFIKITSKESLEGSKDNVFKSTVNLKVTVAKPFEKPSEVVKIFHKHSVSDPVKDISYNEMIPYGFSQKQPGSFHTFSGIQPPVAFRNDINVTSRDEKVKKELSAAEALMTIKRRNYPKVLPDYPTPDDFMAIMAQKRLSLPPQNHLLFLPTSEESSVANSEANSPTEHRKHIRGPPLPPPRSSSTLGRKPPFPESSSFDSGRHPKLHSRNPSDMYVEMSANTLPSTARFNTSKESVPYYATIAPKPRNKVNLLEMGTSGQSFNDTTDSERGNETDSSISSYEQIRPQPKVIISANPETPVQKTDGKIIIKPIINRKPSANRPTHIPRVLARDNSFEKSDVQNTNSSSSNPNAVITRIHTPDGMIANLLKASDVKPEIPVYIPDAKGPPTEDELKRIKTNIEKANVALQKPDVPSGFLPRNVSNSSLVGKTSVDSMKIDHHKTNTSEKSNTSKSGGGSKIPKTPTMSSKMNKKEQPKVHANSSNPKLNKNKNQNKNNAVKNSSIPQLVPNQKLGNGSSDKDLSTSESSNDTESSTGTVKKVK